MSFDLVIRGGTVVDGTGAPARTADVAITDGRVVEVGPVDGAGRREIDADGALVTPGFVDIHTHYDGQATWDERLQPSSLHGVTTVVTGNCGVGFAPVRAADHDLLVELMEGVEDIPGAVLHEGLPWEWESIGRVPRRARPAALRHRPRRAGVPRAGAPLRDGRARRRPRGGHRRRDRRDGPPRRRGRSAPARSASPRRARSTTGRAGASRRRRSPPPATSWSASPAPSARPGRACCRSCPTSPTATARPRPCSR